jgi:hypothetical protein
LSSESRHGKVLAAGTAWLLAVALAAGSANALAQSAHRSSGYGILREIALPEATGWDYLAVDAKARLLYISDNSGALAFDLDAEKLVGRIPPQPFASGVGFVHGVAIAEEFNRGFLSHEMPPSVLIFDLATRAQIGVTPTDAGTDAVIYDPASKRIFTFNGKQAGIQDATVIDAATGNWIANIPLAGRPEFPAVDEHGSLFVNLASTSEIARIDTRALKVTAVWHLTKCEHASGLAIDRSHRRLFAACDNALIAMIDADKGEVISTVRSGEGTDAIVFDPGTGYAISSNGEGTITVAHEDSPDKLTLLENVKTRPSARTLALDPSTHRLYLMAAKFETKRPASATPDNPHRYPAIVPGTATLLIMGPAAQ